MEDTDKNFKEILKSVNGKDFEIFKERYDSFKHTLEDIKKEFPPESLESLTNLFKGILGYIAEDFKFRLEFVIDTNIIYAELLAILNGNPSFLLKIIDFPFLSIFAPIDIKEELFSTIKEDLPEYLNKEEAFSLANSFLKKITILEQNQAEAWEKAINLLGDYDRDDVPFLALSFSLNAHGLISRDKHFKRQKEMKILKLGECGKMTLLVSHGVFSLFLLDVGLKNILGTIVKWLFLIFQGFLEFCYEVYDSIKFAFNYLKEKYSNLPKWAQIAIPILSIVIPSLILAFSEKSRKRLKDFLIKQKYKLINLSRHLHDIFKYNIEIIKELLVKLTPFFELTLDGLGYLIYSAFLLLEQLKVLNKDENV